MSLKNEIVTLEDNSDYLVYEETIYNEELFYLLLKIEDDEVTDEVLIVKYNSDNSFEPIEDEQLYGIIKERFLTSNINKEHKVPTPHIEANYEDIAPLVIMPGDPARAKKIAKKFLVNSKLVNDVREIYAYTGFYNQKRVTVMAAGMGMPSAGIYYHELYKFYDVKKIIRVGTCGGATEDEDVLDIVIADKAYTASNFAKTYSNSDNHISYPSFDLTKKLEESCKKLNTKYHIGGVNTMDFFGPYIDTKHLYQDIPEDFELKAEEMECFGLLHIANTLGKEAACILTVSDSPYRENELTSDERENGLDKMIEIALDAITSK